MRGGGGGEAGEAGEVGGAGAGPEEENRSRNVPVPRLHKLHADNACYIRTKMYLVYNTRMKDYATHLSAIATRSRRRCWFGTSMGPTARI